MAIGDDGRDLAFYLLLLPPLEFVMTSRRFTSDGSRKRAVMIAGSALALAAAAKVGYELVKYIILNIFNLYMLYARWVTSWCTSSPRTTT